MSNREALIARKQTVRRQIEQLVRQVEAARQTQPPVPPRRLRWLEQELERLMSEETNLRQAIDRSA
jgi:phage FluMu protein gp41